MHQDAVQRRSRRTKTGNLFHWSVEVNSGHQSHPPPNAQQRKRRIQRSSVDPTNDCRTRFQAEGDLVGEEEDAECEQENMPGHIMASI